MSKWSRRVLAVVCVTAVCLALAGCQSVAQNAAEKIVSAASGGAVSTNGGQTTVKTPSGQVTIGGGQTLPSTMPKDVPIYSNPKIIASAQAEEGGKPAWTVSYLAADPPQTIISWYASQLKSGGWTDTTTSGAAQASVITSNKGNETLSVAVVPSSQSGYQSSVTLAVHIK
jgi:hypothetical protein